MTKLRDLSKWQGPLFLTTLVITLCLVLALLAEGAVRFRQWLKYGFLWGIEQTYEVDRKTGLRVLVPGTELGSIKINSLGFRGPEVQVPKPVGTIRLAFLGASTTYCAEVSNNAMTWPHLVWAKLQDQWPSIRFDYINAAVPGYDVAHSLKALQHRIKHLGPDIIFIYHATNDVSTNSFRLAVKNGIATKRTEQTLSWLSKYSLLSYLAEKNALILWQQRRARDPQQKLSFDAPTLAEPFRKDLTALVRESKEIADLVVLITFSHRLRRDQTPEDQAAAAVTSFYYMPYMSIDGLLSAFDAYNQVIREVAAETAALLIGDELTIPGDGNHFVDSVHFTDTGSRAMAKRVADGLLESPVFTRLVQR